MARRAYKRRTAAIAEPSATIAPEAAPAPQWGNVANLGDWDNDGVAGGMAPTPADVPGREKTLHELNLEARAIDRHHAALRAAAEAELERTVAPMLAGVPRRRMISRRMQKNLRPVVKD